MDSGVPTDEAVERGIRGTASTVTSAAAVMVAVFAIFASLRTLDMKQMGVGLAVAVLLDATVIRGVLLPAAMRLLGDWNWYLPRRLERVPRLTLEPQPRTPPPDSCQQRNPQTRWPALQTARVASRRFPAFARFWTSSTPPPETHASNRRRSRGDRDGVRPQPWRMNSFSKCRRSSIAMAGPAWSVRFERGRCRSDVCSLYAY